jgi:hypothetical protein
MERVVLVKSHKTPSGQFLQLRGFATGHVLYYVFEPISRKTEGAFRSAHSRAVHFVSERNFHYDPTA